MINTIKLQNNGFLVNGLMYVPNDPRNKDYQAVQRWLVGRTDEWLALEEQFNNGEIDALPDLIPNVPEPEFTQAELDAQAIAETNAAIDAELLALDMASIRDIREYIASKPDAPQLLKDREIEAAMKRAERV